jgi:predicted ferric reductase
LAARYILPGGLISVDFGIFALLGMIILLIITLYGAWKYQHWKFSHEFLGAFFILAVLHILLVRNTVARDNIFNGYYFYAIIVSVIGLTGFIYSLLRNRLKGKMYRINGVNAISGCFEILLEPIDELVKKHDDASNGAGNGAGIKFKSGQFVFVRFLNKGVGRESHPFSIAAPSGTGGFRIIVKSLGDFTSQLGKLHEGNKVIVEGPYGRFHNENHKKNNTDDNNDSSNSGSKNDFSDEIWVAGGIGITPFLGLAEDFRHSKTGRVDLYYSVKNKNEFVHLEELHDIARFNKSFRVFPWISDESGYLNIDAIAKNGNLKHHRYYLCGPVSLKSAIRDALIKKGIPNKYIHDERFAFK